MKPSVKCPECYSTELYKNGKDKNANQKYLCRKCRRQFTLQSIKKLNNPKCPVCGKGMYLHHKYKYHVSFKCNNRQCSHTIKQLIPIAIDDPSSEKLFGKDTFSGHRFSISTIINTINLYYSLNATTRAISTYLLDCMNIKVSHVTISKWIKKFDKYFKSISDKLTKGLYLGDSDEWHADETVVRINGKKHYIWICIDSETRFVTSWNLNQSRGSECAFSLLKKLKPLALLSQLLQMVIEPIKSTFKNSTHIVVEDFDDDISNNLIESFNKTFKSWYKKTKDLSHMKVLIALLVTLFFTTILLSLINHLVT